MSIWRSSGNFRFLKVGEIGLGNFMQVLSNGTIRLNGDARTWTDFLVPLDRSKIGILDKPDYDFTRLGLLFPSANTSEIVYQVFQMLHQKALDVSLRMHLHYLQEVATQPTFKIDYKFYNNGAEVPGSWTTLSTANGSKGIYTFTSNPILQIAQFPTISTPLNEGLSANLDLKLYRDDGDIAGDILAKYIDFHFLIDSLGSDEEYTK